MSGMVEVVDEWCGESGNWTWSVGEVVEVAECRQSKKVDGARLVREKARLSIGLARFARM